MKFMLLIGGNREAWEQLTPDDWAQSVRVHETLIAELRQTGEFRECEELNVTAGGSRIIKSSNGVVTSDKGPLHDDGNFASGYYLIDCLDIERASDIAGRLYESRFAPIEVRRLGQ